MARPCAPCALRLPHPRQLGAGEREVLEAYCADLYVATTDRLDLQVRRQPRVRLSRAVRSLLHVATADRLGLQARRQPRVRLSRACVLGLCGPRCTWPPPPGWTRRRAAVRGCLGRPLLWAPPLLPLVPHCCLAATGMVVLHFGDCPPAGDDQYGLRRRPRAGGGRLQAGVRLTWAFRANQQSRQRAVGEATRNERTQQLVVAGCKRASAGSWAHGSAEPWRRRRAACSKETNLSSWPASAHRAPPAAARHAAPQVVDALREGRVDRQREPEPLQDVRLSTAVTAVRLPESGVGVEVEVAGQVRAWWGGKGEGRAPPLSTPGGAGEQLLRALHHNGRCRALRTCPHAAQEEPLRAHAVLCTLPLGCLQKGTVRFEPPLPGVRAGSQPERRPAACGAVRSACLRVLRRRPGSALAVQAAAAALSAASWPSRPRPLPGCVAEYKQEAIRGLGMGTEDRVAMLFDEVRSNMHALPAVPPPLLAAQEGRAAMLLDEVRRPAQPRCCVSIPARAIALLPGSAAWPCCSTRGGAQPCVLACYLGGPAGMAL